MTNETDWSPCESGTLSDLQQNLSGDSSSVQWTRRGALTAVVVAAAGGTWMMLRDQPPGEMSCADVHQFADAYVRKDLAVDVLNQINVHRSKCRACDSKLTSMERQRDSA